MSNEQLYFAIGLPCFTIVASLIVTVISVSGIREDIRQIRDSMRDMRSDLQAAINTVREDTSSSLKTIREDSNSLIKEIREDIREIRSDIKILTGKVYELMGEKH